MKLRREEIESRAFQVLEQSDARKIPVDVERVAAFFGAQLHRAILEDEVSAMLAVKGLSKHIIVNAAHHPNRQRFSIAHEIGHLLMHHNPSEDRLFVDTKMVVYQRAGTPTATAYSSSDSTTTPEEEREANVFAAALLMPKSLLEDFIDDRKLDIEDEFDVSVLATAFQVSEQAISIRLKTVGLIDFA